MALKYIKGDLFRNLPKTGEICIPHVCNDVGGFGSGFAYHMAKQFPIVQRSYFEFYKSKKDLQNQPFQLGVSQVVEIYENERILYAVNMIAQHGLIGPDNPHPLDYNALRLCMESVVRRKQDGEEIHCPKFGSELSGGSWDVVEKMIREIWKDFEITVYFL